MLKHSNGFINVVFLFCLTIKYSGFLVSCIFSHHPTLWIHFHLETSEMDDFGPSLSSAACYFSSRRCDATLETWRLLQEKYKKEVRTWRMNIVTFSGVVVGSCTSNQVSWTRKLTGYGSEHGISSDCWSDSQHFPPLAKFHLHLWQLAQWFYILLNGIFFGRSSPPIIFWIKIWYDSLLA